MKIVFMFSGQGSQYYQMGRKLFDTNNVFRRNMLALDEVVKSVQGVSIVDELYSAKHKLFDPFTSLRLTHPAIFMTAHAVVKVLEEQGIFPDLVLGCSLGEFTAAAVAGISSAENTIKLIVEQARVIENNCYEGRLMAVLQDLNVYHDTPELKNNSALASINAPSQFVIAGECDKINQVKKFMKEKEILHQELMVQYGFHSSSIDLAAGEYKSYLKSCNFKTPSIPMISGVYGRQLDQLPEDYFWTTVRDTTQFSRAIETVERFFSQEELVYIDLGTGSLANLIRYNVPASSKSKAFQIMSPFQQEIKKLEEIKNYFDQNRKDAFVKSPSAKNQLLAYVFPGQGSQRKGMGQELFDIFPELTEKASNVLGYSIKELCLSDPERNLNKTQYTQPALYVVNALSYLKLVEENSIMPDFVAGHSLGEYNALFAANAFDFETGLKLVQKRGALMAKMKEGGMAAVKGLSVEEIKAIIARNHLDEIDMANYNTQNQIVLSGPRELIAKSGTFFESAGATLYFPLNVNGAFHSRYMAPARDEFKKFLEEFSFSPLRIPVVSNVEASLYSLDSMKRLLADQLTKPVRWTESITFIQEKGNVAFKEVGPGDVLTKLVWKIQQDLQELVQ